MDVHAKRFGKVGGITAGIYTILCSRTAVKYAVNSDISTMYRIVHKRRINRITRIAIHQRLRSFVNVTKQDCVTFRIHRYAKANKIRRKINAPPSRLSAKLPS